MERLIVGLTGGVASGKTVFSRFFAEWQVPIIDADVLARRLLDQGEIRQQLVALFGSAALRCDGMVDRSFLRARLFGSQTARQQLETILHPAIWTGLYQDAHTAPVGENAYVIVVIPLLVETGGKSRYPWLQRIAVVTAPPQQRLQRLIARDRIDRILAEQMLAAQADDAQRAAIADDVVANTGSLAQLRTCAQQLHTRYCALARQSRLSQGEME